MLFRFSLILCIFGFALYWVYIRIEPRDLFLYQTLIEESRALRTRKALGKNPAHQKRETVQKEIWTQNESRHFQIESQTSELTVSQNQKEIGIREEFRDIRCTIPNELTLTAERGIYTYPSQTFIAEQNCRLIQGGNEIEGTKIELDFLQETAVYENPIGKLPSIPLSFKAKRLIWEKKKERLYLTDQVEIEKPEQFLVFADQGTVELDQRDPSLLILNGDVRLISSGIEGKPAYARADRLTYDPREKTLLFSGDQRVVFWQEGLSLSAFEILIRSDQSVEGRGEVHFSLDLEEQNYIEELFGQYL